MLATMTTRRALSILAVLAFGLAPAGAADVEPVPPSGYIDGIPNYDVDLIPEAEAAPAEVGDWPDLPTYMVAPYDYVRVIDGDTMVLTVDLGDIPIRLEYIDAPELDQECMTPGGQLWACGETAKAYLQNMIRGKLVMCSCLEADLYRRPLCICNVNYPGEVGSPETLQNINGELVRAGMALDYTQYSDGFFAKEEAEARELGRGVWSGQFMTPWDWRARMQRPSDAATEDRPGVEH